MSISRLMQMGAAGQGGAGFQISPAFNGKTEWSFAADGSLNIGTHGEYTITPNSNLSVDVKMWGAGGCFGWAYTNSTPISAQQSSGGGGGYSSGTVTLTAGTTYIFQIGEGGDPVISSSGATYVAGGVASSVVGAEGGGYSGIFNTSVSQANAILIAGGGGGGGDNRYDGAGAGAGGGSSGQDSDHNTSGSTSTWQGGGGGTQSSGGYRSFYNQSQAGSALTGGNGQRNQSSLGGGGGGYYGGGGGNVGGGGGGSGYIGSGVTNGVTTTGNRATPANSSDTDRNGSGAGGIDVNTQSGTDGRILISEA